MLWGEAEELARREDGRDTFVFQYLLARFEMICLGAQRSELKHDLFRSGTEVAQSAHHLVSAHAILTRFCIFFIFFFYKFFLVSVQMSHFSSFLSP